jgi:hypothetical protein
MQPPEQPAGAKTCSIELSALSERKLLPEGLMLGGAIDNGDCFFDSIFQVLKFFGIPNCQRCVDVRFAVKKSWDAKREEDASADLNNLESCDNTLLLPSCVADLKGLKKLEGFKNWLIQPADYITDRVNRQLGKPGFSDDFPTHPYWGGFMDLQVAELLVFLTMNMTDCTLQSLLQQYDVTFHVINITGSKSQSPEVRVATAIGVGTHHVWLANVDQKHWVPVWKQPIPMSPTVQISTTTTTTTVLVTTTTFILILLMRLLQH